MAVLIRFILSAGECDQNDDSINGRISTLEATTEIYFISLMK